MSSLDLTRDWLQTVLRPYPSRERIIPEVLGVLTQWKTLAVKTDAFTFDSGLTALLLLLHGTIPITYRGATYHIPIHVWIPLEYPRNPPLAFVVPTKEMGVRKGREVEPGGRVTEDVVNEWWRSWETKTIETLLKHLTAIFSSSPPVYARPPEQATASPSRPAVVTQMSPQSTGPRAAQSPAAFPTSPIRTAQQPGQPPPPPARPAFMPDGMPETLPQYRPAPTPPPHPYPPNNVQTPPRQASGSYPYQAAQSPPPPAQSPPVPNRPAQVPRAGSLPPGSPQVPNVPQRPYNPATRPGGPNQLSTSAQPGPPPPALGPSYAQQPMPQLVEPRYAPFQDGYQTGYPSQSPQQYQPAPPQSYPPQPSQTSQQTPLGQPAPATHPLQANANPTYPAQPPQPLQPPQAREPAPGPQTRPSPTRGSRVRRAGNPRRDGASGGSEEGVRLGWEKGGRCGSQGSGEGGRSGRTREVSVDEVVCGISIVHNQLIDLVAEDNAIEDTIYHICRALDAERIDLDRFLKSIRSLAREQYMKRALIERILQGMGQKQGW
ncbi:hypothetical protein EHS25_008284 [Saitozyma podzolica]|uniref:UEV domain-containing protein n=1 Tax=Saitozyma podzolica TaxID=1890683 RepID=A0A427YNZ7_9TREE|nr:hypothetical protein EHS25_008284 [Saitozyma podzolica]